MISKKVKRILHRRFSRQRDEKLIVTKDANGLPVVSSQQDRDLEEVGRFVAKVRRTIIDVAPDLDLARYSMAISDLAMMRYFQSEIANELIKNGIISKRTGEVRSSMTDYRALAHDILQQLRDLRLVPRTRGDPVEGAKKTLDIDHLIETGEARGVDDD